VNVKANVKELQKFKNIYLPALALNNLSYHGGLFHFLNQTKNPYEKIIYKKLKGHFACD